jgi:hypothetical protein
MSHHTHKVEYDEVIQQSPCSEMYKVVQECLEANDRDWAACKEPVAKWKACFASHANK